MHSVVAAGAGFLLAVLWFDLMFDVQVLRYRNGDMPEPVLASIAAYYRRVTTDARPMNRLVMVTMVITLLGILHLWVRNKSPQWVSITSLVLAVAPIGLAGARTVPNAKRLGSRSDEPAKQSDLARSILRQHLLCVVSIAMLLAVQLIWS